MPAASENGSHAVGLASYPPTLLRGGLSRSETTFVTLRDMHFAFTPQSPFTGHPKLVLVFTTRREEGNPSRGYSRVEGGDASNIAG